MALDASSTKGELAAALLGHFDEVHVLRTNLPDLERVRVTNRREGWHAASFHVGVLRTAPWPAATFDCIAMHDMSARRQASTDDLQKELNAARRLLRPHGWLALASPNPSFLGRRLGRTRGIPRRLLSQLLVRAKFSQQRCLFAAPTLERPLTVVPEAGDAVSAYELSDTLRDARSLARRAAVRLGLHSVLYPAYFLLARA
jgi:hypothetical protein